MKKLSLIALILMASVAHADLWSNCTAYGGTIITANKYGDDKGGLCNDPNDTNLTNNCNGKKFCLGGKQMNWWSAFTWCESIGGQLASFASMCPNTQALPSNAADGECPNLTKVSGTYWVTSNMGWQTEKMLTVNLADGRISSGSGAKSGTRAFFSSTMKGPYAFCEEK